VTWLWRLSGGGFLCYRTCFDGWKGRESTGCKATARNRAKLERKAAVMSDLMAEGRFDYLEWFSLRSAEMRPMSRGSVNLPGLSCLRSAKC